MTDEKPYQQIRGQGQLDKTENSAASRANPMFWSLCASSCAALALGGAIPVWFWTSDQPSIWLLLTSIAITILASPMLYIGTLLKVKNRYVLLVVTGYSVPQR